jgi:hypothetical protein
MTAFTCSTYDEFDAHYGRAVANELFSRICEAAYDPKRPQPGVTITNIHRHNAINMTFEGVLLHDGIEFSFVIDDGDWNGTEVREFTTHDLAPYEPPQPTRYTLVPTDGNLKENRPAMYEAYLRWTREPWFQELLRAYHYDRHFQPGLVVERHYREKAAERGLKLEYADSDRAVRIQADLAALAS